MKSPIRALFSKFSRIVHRGVASLDAPQPRRRYGQPSGMIKLHLARSAALAEATRRTLHEVGGVAPSQGS
jgi:hypothetical protein